MLDWTLILLGVLRLWSPLGSTLPLFTRMVGFPNQVNTCYLFLNNIGKLLLVLLFIIIVFKTLYTLGWDDALQFREGLFYSWKLTEWTQCVSEAATTNHVIVVSNCVVDIITHTKGSSARTLNMYVLRSILGRFTFENSNDTYPAIKTPLMSWDYQFHYNLSSKYNSSSCMAALCFCSSDWLISYLTSFWTRSVFE